MSADSSAREALQPLEQQIIYTPRDAILCALSAGLGGDPGATRESAYVTDAARVMPSLAGALIVADSLLERAGFARATQPVHEAVALRRPLADAGSLSVTTRFKRASAGELELHSEARAVAADAVLFDVHRRYRQDAPPPAPPMPAREPDLVSEIPTSPEQLLIARLIAPRDPLAAAPDRGSRVMDHSLVMTLVCRAVLETICEFDHTLIKSLSTQFAGPLAAGETLCTEMWQEANIVTFRALAVERATAVVSAGRCELAT